MQIFVFYVATSLPELKNMWNRFDMHNYELKVSVN